MALLSQITLETSPTPCAWWFGPEESDSLPVFRAQVAKSTLYPFRADDLGTPFRTFGWTRIARSPRGLTITWDVEAGASGGLDAVCNLLDRARLRSSVDLHYCWSGAWARERVASPREGARRIDQIRRFRSVSAFESALLDELALDGVDQEPDLIGRAWRWWDGAGAWKALQPPAPLSRSSSVFRANDQGHLELEQVGDRSSLAVVFGRQWARKALHAKSLPDAKYDSAVSSPYQRVLSKGSPTLDRVTAAIQTWAAPEPLWIGYTRLLVPSPANSVTCFTKITSRACMPIMCSMSA